MSITQVSEERWKEAQAAEYEYWRDQGDDGDDWNQWWFQQFDGYGSVNWPAVDSIMEVGCGPFAKNTQLIVEAHLCNRDPVITLNDPLIYQYAALGKSVRGFLDYTLARANGLPLEEIDNLPRIFDAIICINVLDHVRDVERCFKAMHSVLNDGGYMILGQELTSPEDMEKCPDVLTDTKHPILLDMGTIDQFLHDSPTYHPVFKKILTREEGRNPKAHYATLIYIGKKL